MRLKILKPAKADIAAIRRWYDREQPGVGLLFGARIEQALGLIDAQPRLYQSYRDDVRRVPLYPYPYTLYYRVLPNHVQVIVIAHEHQDPKQLAQAVADRYD